MKAQSCLPNTYSGSKWCQRAVCCLELIDFSFQIFQRPVVVATSFAGYSHLSRKTVLLFTAIQIVLVVGCWICNTAELTVQQSFVFLGFVGMLTGSPSRFWSTDLFGSVLAVAVILNHWRPLATGNIYIGLGFPIFADFWVFDVGLSGSWA